MRRLGAIALVWPALARAWDVEQIGPVRGADPVVAVEIVEVEGATLLVLGGQSRTTVTTPAGVTRADLPYPAVALERFDVDADGDDEILLCGAAGLVALDPTGFATAPLTTTPCDDVARVVDPTGAHLYVADGTLRRYDVGEGGLIDRGPVGNFVGKPRLAAAERRLGAADTERTRIAVFDGSERREILASGVVGDLVATPSGFLWTIPRLGVAEDEAGVRWPIGPSPSRVLPAQLDADGVGDLVVLHRDNGTVAAVAGRGGGRQSRYFPEGPSAVAVGRLDDDPCDDLVVGFAETPGYAVLYTRPCAPAPVVEPPSPDEAAPLDLSGGWRAPEPVAPRPRVLGAQVPTFLGARSASPVERLRYQRYVVVGSGWAMGSTLDNVWFQIPFFPALAVEMEGGGPRTRWFVGGDSAALFFWITERGGGIHLANASAGVTFGSPRLRTGPFVTGGLLNYGAGLRTVFTPWADGWNTFKGIEMRLTWFAPGTGEVMLLYVWSQPMRPARGVANATSVSSAPSLPPLPPGDTEEPWPVIGSSPPRSPKVGCHTFHASAGALVGGSSTRYSWDYVGSTVPVAVSGSPMVSLGCESHGPAGRLYVGADTAPVFSYLTRRDDRLHHMAAYTMGFMFGDERFRLGPIGTAGVWVLGGGVRGVIRLREDRQGLDHHLDVRALALAPSAPAAQLAILYGISVDPWR